MEAIPRVLVTITASEQICLMIIVWQDQNKNIQNASEDFKFDYAYSCRCRLIWFCYLFNWPDKNKNAKDFKCEFFEYFS